MSLFQHIKPDIPFFRDDSQRFIPKIIAMVMVLVTFMFLIALSLGQTVRQSSEAQSGRVLVQIPAQAQQEEIVNKVLQTLRESSLVKKVERVSDAEIQKQMKPWLGEMGAFEALPMPAVIRISWKDQAGADLVRLRTLLMPISPTIQVDAPSEWAANFARFSRIVQLVLVCLSGALLASAAVLLAFTSLTSLKLHQRTVALLHSIGAHDAYIASQFQMNAALLALRGAAIGSVLALLLFALVGMVVRSLHVAMLPDLAVGWVHVLVAVLLPFAAACVGFFTARVATFRYLNQFL